MIRLDTPLCGKCGYDLTGLAQEGRCPECGNPFDRRRGLGITLQPTPEEQGARLMKLLRTIALAAMTLLVGGTSLGLDWLGYPYALSVGLVGLLILGSATLVSYIHGRENR